MADAPYGVDPESVATFSDLAAELKKLHILADGPSLRQLQTTTRNQPTPLTKTAVSEMLKGVRLPRKAVMIAFLEACGVSSDDHGPWLQVWERLKLQELASRDTTSGKAVIRTRLHEYIDTRSGAVEAERLREQIEQLTADNVQLRLRLASDVPDVGARDLAGIEVDLSTMIPNPIAARRELGARLRGLRMKQEMTIEEVAERLLCPLPEIDRLENAFQVIFPEGTRRNVRDLCDLYGIGETSVRDYLMKLATRGMERGGWEPFHSRYQIFVGLEDSAQSAQTYHSAAIPGLLQTAGYARSTSASFLPNVGHEQTELGTQLKLRRKQILTRASPLRLWVILDETALRRHIGGAAVMQQQLQHVLQVVRLANVTVQVLPFAVGDHPALDNSFTILRFAEPVPDIAFVDGLFGEIYIEEPRDIDLYRRTFEKLQKVALDEHDSIDFIRRVLAEAGSL
jgi:transcriptional regulator with XRE-family HTH domain